MHRKEIFSTPAVFGDHFPEDGAALLRRDAHALHEPVELEDHQRLRLGQEGVVAGVEAVPRRRGGRRERPRCLEEGVRRGGGEVAPGVGRRLEPGRGLLLAASNLSQTVPLALQDLQWLSRLSRGGPQGAPRLSRGGPTVCPAVGLGVLWVSDPLPPRLLMPR